MNSLKRSFWRAPWWFTRSRIVALLDTSSRLDAAIKKL